ncbi:Hypothetical_protein [Hexamita inflata]|uniref:Hypothetical_protein n=1 Tax=Hexamita inflata TaxID=28002 RepID=A0ABP1I715_9EUKA
MNSQQLSDRAFWRSHIFAFKLYIFGSSLIQIPICALRNVKFAKHNLQRRRLCQLACRGLYTQYLTRVMAPEHSAVVTTAFHQSLKCRILQAHWCLALFFTHSLWRKWEITGLDIQARGPSEFRRRHTHRIPTVVHAKRASREQCSSPRVLAWFEVNTISDVTILPCTKYVWINVQVIKMTQNIIHERRI